MTAMEHITRNRMLAGLGVAILAFGALGTVSALWNNPFFFRMTPVQGFEIPLLAILALLSGTFVTVRRPVCAAKKATGAGILGFLGVACPVCNKILLFIFGGELLMTYFEPVRIYVTIASIALMAWLVWREVRQGQKKRGQSSAEAA